MLNGQQITILGGGIGGFAAACALSQRGASVTVLEQAPDLGEVGAGLQISPNGVRILDALGLGEAARARAMRSRGVRLRDGLSGREVITLDLARLRVSPRRPAGSAGRGRPRAGGDDPDRYPRRTGRPERPPPGAAYRGGRPPCG